MLSNRLVIVIILTTGLFVLATQFAAAGQRLYVDGELLVKYKNSADTQSRGALQRAAGVRRDRAIGGSRIHRVFLHSGTTVEQAMAVYAADPNVEFAEPNYILNAQALPDDTRFLLQWGLHNSGQVVSGYVGTAGSDIDAQNAWDISTGAGTVLVAVVDTGCDLNHPDLADNIWANPQEIADNGIDDDGNGFIDDVHGWDFMDMDSNPQDASGHGSHVAGIIAAAGDNDRGIAGVAWNVRILPLRFMNAFNQGSTSDAISAINYAVAMGARIINCSWGGSGYSASLYNTMASTDALFVCAAGNDGVNLDDSPFYPASFNADNVISVAASDQMDGLCGFSNFSTTIVNVAAPGVRIYSTGVGRRTIWSESFEDGSLSEMAGWSTGGSGDTWGIGGPPGYSALKMLALSPDGDYENSADTWVQAPDLDLSDAAGSVVTFSLIGSSQPGVDLLYLDVSTDAQTWYNRPLMVGGTIEDSGISGTLYYFSTVTADLGPWDRFPRLYLRFRFHSDPGTAADGFYIDDIALKAGAEQDIYQYMQGTSMAAGYVSGIAALIQSENDSLSPLEIRSLIEDSVDPIEDLVGSTAAGGRVNAGSALSLQNGFSLPDTSLERSDSGGGGGGGGCFIDSL